MLAEQRIEALAGQLTGHIPCQTGFPRGRHLVDRISNKLNEMRLNRRLAGPSSRPRWGSGAGRSRLSALGSRLSAGAAHSRDRHGHKSDRRARACAAQQRALIVIGQRGIAKQFTPVHRRPLVEARTSPDPSAKRSGVQVTRSALADRCTALPLRAARRGVHNSAAGSGKSEDGPVPWELGPRPAAE